MRISNTATVVYTDIAATVVPKAAGIMQVVAG